MEVVRELHDAVAKACEASFDNAYQQLKSQLDAQVKAAEAEELAASQARRQAESRIESLQHDIAVLQTELQRYEADPQDLELPRKYANLEADFHPRGLWGSTRKEDQVTRKSCARIEAQYTALYDNLQTFIGAWNGLKRKVLQHKEKLRQWDQQLKLNEFTLIRNGEKVKYRKVQELGPEGIEKKSSRTPQSSLGKRSRDQAPDLPVNESDFSRETREKTMPPTLRGEEDDCQTENIRTSKPASTQSSFPESQNEPSGASGTVNPVSSCNIKRERTALSPTLPNFSVAHCQRTDVGSQRPVHVKEEIMSSSPIRASLNFSDRPFVGTQDLDDIGDTIRTPTKRRAYWDAHAPKTQSSERSINHAHHRSQQVCNQPSALQAVDGNARLSTISGQRSSMEPIDDLKRRAIAAMAEDGDSMEPVRSSSRTAPGNHQLSEAKIPSMLAQKRLGDLLERSTPSKSPLYSSKNRSGPNSTKADVVPQHNHLATSATGDEAPDIDPNDEPYRAMPLSCLGLGHFKINPARNQGFDFAYDTVVRKKDERKCISGCTRPGCCGDRFRAMARLAGLPSRHGAEQEQEDENMLREFLGENIHVLQTEDDQGRRKLLIEARARALANQYGRHRHTHQRAQSPPGFWRTDMPSTQEEELDREAAKRLEREKVEERYREAMRPGGLWVFADE